MSSTEFNTLEFKKEMLDKKTNVTELSKLLFLSKQSVYNKIKGYTPFSISEIRFLITHWKLTSDRVVEIFFNKKLQ